MSEDTQRLEAANLLAMDGKPILVSGLMVRVESNRRYMTLPPIPAVARDVRHGFGRVDILAEFSNGEQAWVSQWSEA